MNPPTTVKVIDLLIVKDILQHLESFEQPLVSSNFLIEKCLGLIGMTYRIIEHDYAYFVKSTTIASSLFLLNGVRLSNLVVLTQQQYDDYIYIKNS